MRNAINRRHKKDRALRERDEKSEQKMKKSSLYRKEKKRKLTKPICISVK